MVDIRRKGKLPPAGPGQPPKSGELMEILKADEKWSTYDLDDGAQIRIRQAVIEIWRVEDEYDAEGNPVYFMKSQQIMSIIAPDKLKKGGGK